MNCIDALDTMLTADLSNVSAGPAALRDHLQQCRRCELVAATLLSQTDALAGVVRAVPLSVTPPRLVTTARTPRFAVLAFAALMLVVLWPYGRRPEAEHVAARSAPGSAPADTMASTIARGTLSLPSNESAVVQPVAAAGQSAAHVSSRLNTTSAATSARAVDQSSGDLGALLNTPEPVEAMPLLAVEIDVDVVALGERELRLEDALSAPTARDSISLLRQPVLLPQSNPHITVFWVF